MTLKKLIRYDVALLNLSKLFPAAMWGKIENACAYFQGKGSIANAMVAEVMAASRFATGDELILFDVGANHGDWTREALRTFGERIAAIYQFEPSPPNIAILKKEFSAPNISVVPYAVSGKKGSAKLFFDKPGSDSASLYERRVDYLGWAFDKFIEIKTITIDDFIAKNKIIRVDYMKMDIERNELAALKGATRALRSGTIRALSFEFGDCNIDSRSYFRDFWRFLSPLGYAFYRILPDGSIYPIREYRENLESFRTTNYIAVRNTA